MLPAILLAASAGLQAQVLIQQNPVYACDTSSDGGHCLRVCAGDTVTYSTPLPGPFYLWDIPGAATVIGGISSTSVTVVWNTPGSYIIQVNSCHEPGQGCDKSQFCIRVEPGAIAAISTDYPLTNGCINICNNTTVTFYNNSV